MGSAQWEAEVTLTREQIAARMEAAAIMVEHAEIFGTAVFIAGPEFTSAVLRVIADRIEAGEFNRETMH